MSEPKDNGGTAFPCNAANLGQAGAYEPDPGMSLRDFFAAKAMQSLVSPEMMPFVTKIAEQDSITAMRCMARAAYEFADAMIAERMRCELVRNTYKFASYRTHISVEVECDFSHEPAQRGSADSYGVPLEPSFSESMPLESVKCAVSGTVIPLRDLDDVTKAELEEAALEERKRNFAEAGI